jgi:hypothetical protein
MFWPVRNLLPRKGLSARPARAAQQSYRFRPALLSLEERTVPSTFVRVTMLDPMGKVQDVQTSGDLGTPPGAAGFAVPVSLMNFTGGITGSWAVLAGSTSLSVSFSLQYNGPVGPSDQVLVEILSNGLTNIGPGSGAQITDNFSPSSSQFATTGTGCSMATSQLDGNVTFGPTPAIGSMYGPITSGNGTATTTGDFTGGASNTFMPNPATGAFFSITNPYTYYQAVRLSHITTATGPASFSNAGVITGPTPPSGTGSTATIGYWHNKNGQGLITSDANGGANGTALGTWLAQQFPNLYGNVFTVGHRKNSDVAAYDLTLFNSGSDGKKYNQLLGVALAIWFNDPALGGAAGQAAGFKNMNTGNALFTITASEAAGAADLGLTVGQSYTIRHILDAANAVAVNGVLPAGTLSDIAQIFNDINEKFDSV